MTGKPIYQLRRGQCRFPVTESDVGRHLFCAEPVEREGVVYCEVHANRCYDRRSPERRRADWERMQAIRAAKEAQAKA